MLKFGLKKKKEVVGKNRSLKPCINQTEKHQHLADTFDIFQIKLKCNINILGYQSSCQYIQKHCVKQ